ncbi:MAG: hypothetical protein K2Q18_11405 [Bdellovibrionales bacterium]|nr:hypothetical protein [Bdellovibrionales bacterium]
MKNVSHLSILLFFFSSFNLALGADAEQFLGLKFGQLYLGQNQNGQYCHVWMSNLKGSLGFTSERPLTAHPHKSEYTEMNITDFETQWKKSTFFEKYSYLYNKNYFISLSGNELTALHKGVGSCTVTLDQAETSLKRIKFLDNEVIPSQDVEYTSATSDSFEFTKIPVSVKPGQDFEFEVITKLSKEKLKDMAAFGFRLVNTKGEDALSDSFIKKNRGEIFLRKRRTARLGETRLSHEFKDDFGPSVTRLAGGNFSFKFQARVPNFDSNGLGTWKLEVGALNFPNYNDFYFSPFTDDQGDVIERGLINFQVKK